MNTWTGIGNVGKDPELRQTASGIAVLNFMMAVDSWRPSPQGSVKTTHWIPVTVFGAQAETQAKRLQKGSHIAVQGELRTRSYTNAQGQKQDRFEICTDKIQWLANIREAN